MLKVESIGVEALDLVDYVFDSQSPLGRVRLTGTDSSLLAVEICALPDTDDAAPNSFLQKARDEIFEYLHQGREEFSLTLGFFGTEFQQVAWRALIEIPYGETRTYKEQATIIGRPKAFRAIARANATNRIPIIVPCHRVITASGGLGGYSAGGGSFGRSSDDGIEIKKFLLELERQNLATKT